MRRIIKLPAQIENKCRIMGYTRLANLNNKVVDMEYNHETAYYIPSIDLSIDKKYTRSRSETNLKPRD